jgi:hypothetical protein
MMTHEAFEAYVEMIAAEMLDGEEALRKFRASWMEQPSRAPARVERVRRLAVRPVVANHGRV